MAAEQASLTPEQAIAVLQENRAYRERPTAHAIGIIWLVWGAALAMLALADMALLFGSEWAGVAFPDAMMWLFIVLFVAFGGTITNMVWRAHALETDPTPRAWLSYVLAGGLVLGSLAFIALEERLIFEPLDLQTPTRISPFLYLVADGALVLGIVARRHVSIVPAIVAAVVAVALQLVMVSVDVARTPENELLWGAGVVIDTLLIYGAVGLWYYNRG